MNNEKLLCIACNEYKTKDEFSTDKTRPSGYYPYCKVCFNEYASINGRERRQAQRLKVLTHYGGNPPKCDCCGEKELEFLDIDHIHGGGTKERKQLKGKYLPHHIIQMDFPEGYRVLCHNCNHSRGIQGYCPHEGRPEDSFGSAVIHFINAITSGNNAERRHLM